MYIISNRPLLQEFESNINILVYRKGRYLDGYNRYSNRTVSYDMIFAVKPDRAGL